MITVLFNSVCFGI